MGPWKPPTYSVTGWSSKYFVNPWPHCWDLMVDSFISASRSPWDPHNKRQKNPWVFVYEDFFPFLQQVHLYIGCIEKTSGLQVSHQLDRIQVYCMVSSWVLIRTLELFESDMVVCFYTKKLWVFNLWTFPANILGYLKGWSHFPFWLMGSTFLRFIWGSWSWCSR